MFGRYPHHLDVNNEYETYLTQYGYDVDHLAWWSELYDPDWLGDKSMHTLLSYTLNIYGFILEACVHFDVDGVLDIGCGCGRQSKMFAESNIPYIGLEASDLPFYGEDRPDCSVVRGYYPDCGNLGMRCGISSHCVGTGLVWDPEAIADDFDIFIGHTYQSYFGALAGLYPNFELIEAENFAYHPEQPRVPMMIAMCWR